MSVILLPKHFYYSLFNNTTSTENFSNLVFPAQAGRKVLFVVVLFFPINDINVVELTQITQFWDNNKKH